MSCQESHNNKKSPNLHKKKKETRIGVSNIYMNYLMAFRNGLRRRCCQPPDIRVSRVLVVSIPWIAAMEVAKLVPHTYQRGN